MQRTERLFAIAEVLRGRRSGVTAQELADRFGVTLRTIYRDLASLQAAELPVRADRGRGGGYALAHHYSLPPVNFSAREAALLLSAGRHLANMRVLPFIATLESALDKVQAALSKSAQRELLQQLDALVFLGVPAPAVSEDVRAALEQAWFEHRPLRICYEGRIASERRVRVRQILMERGVTLLNCNDLDNGEPRQFRLDRIRWATVLEAEAPPAE